MTIRTKRKTLRKLSAVDVEDLYELDRDLEVRRYIDDARPPAPWPEYRDATLKKLESFSVPATDLGFWSARLEDETFIGWFHLRPNTNVFPGEMEIGYRLHRKFWRQGLATEGTRRLLNLAISEHGLGYVMGTTLAANIGSRRVMEKAGMQFEKSFTYPEDLAPHWNEEERAAVKYSLTA
jgi:RimJ/RimL family protein N-acetyltransferase